MADDTERCSWKCCHAITTQWREDGWSNLSDWGPAVPDGYYCPARAAALEAVLLEGGFDDPEDDGRS
jgi:hypothetical protein